MSDINPTIGQMSTEAITRKISLFVCKLVNSSISPSADRHIKSFNTLRESETLKLPTINDINTTFLDSRSVVHGPRFMVHGPWFIQTVSL